MNVEVTAPSEHAGDVIGDLNGRRGRIVGMEPEGEVVSVRAQVPMSEMLTYESSLRSMTGGRGGYSMEFSHYEEVPGQLAEKVVAAPPRPRRRRRIRSSARCFVTPHRVHGLRPPPRGRRRLLTVCERCGQMLAVRYDLPRVAAAVTKEALRPRPPGMYRFRELAAARPPARSR